MKSCKNINSCFIFHHEEMRSTHICRLGYWPTTGCCSGRLSSFPQWAQTQTGTQSAEHLHLESHYPLGSRTGVCPGHHNSLCQFLWKWEAGVEVRRGDGEREKKRIKSSQVLQATFPPSLILSIKVQVRSLWAKLGCGEILWREQKWGKTGRPTDGQKGRQENEIISFLNETGPDINTKVVGDDISLCTLIVDLKANWAHTLIRLKMKPHLMGHADNQVWYKAPSQPVGHRTQKDLRPTILIFDNLQCSIKYCTFLNTVYFGI